MMPVRNNNQNWFPSIFNDFFDNDWVAKVNTATPAVNVIEDDKCFKVEVAAPGMTKEDFSINLNENDELVISMAKKKTTKRNICVANSLTRNSSSRSSCPTTLKRTKSRLPSPMVCSL